jgi:hypothetical protein
MEQPERVQQLWDSLGFVSAAYLATCNNATNLPLSKKACTL